MLEAMAFASGQQGGHSLTQINRRGGVAVSSPDGPRFAVHATLTSLALHPGDWHCLSVFQCGSVWLTVRGRRDSLMRVCVRAGQIPACHQTEWTTRTESAIGRGRYPGSLRNIATTINPTGTRPTTITHARNNRSSAMARTRTNRGHLTSKRGDGMCGLCQNLT